MGCSHEDKLASVLRALSGAPGRGGEGHVRFHLGMLDGKFFKRMQVLKAKTCETRTLLDEAEDLNPALKHQPLNKKDQTLRGRSAIRIVKPVKREPCP